MKAALDESGELTVEIIDNGCGIRDVRQARQPFFTTMEASERSGMGFTVMESFMDSVEVLSRPGQGTTVRMTKRVLAPRELAREA